jgi:hypothetical protein
MATTYTLISSNVLASSAAFVTFSAIPATYTDLVIRMSVRTDVAGSGGEGIVRINNDTSALYSNTELQGNGNNNSGSSSRSSGQSNIFFANIVGGTGTTANTFSNGEIYISNYTVSQNRQFSSFHAQETNAQVAYLYSSAILYRDSTVISRLDLICNSGNWVSGSSFYLYGISNA